MHAQHKNCGPFTRFFLTILRDTTDQCSPSAPLVPIYEPVVNIWQRSLECNRPVVSCIHTQDDTNRITQTYVHATRGIRAHCPVSGRQKLVCPLGRAATAIAFLLSIYLQSHKNFLHNFLSVHISSYKY
jgi:hypothetical protein